MCIEKCGTVSLFGCPEDRASTVVSAGKWRRHGRRLVLASALVTGSVGLVGVSQAAADCVDSDGDGWGWDGAGTCEPGLNESDGNESDPASTDYSGRADGEFASDREIDLPLVDRNECVDTDGDGWGWTGSASCLMPDADIVAAHSPDDNRRSQVPTDANDPFDRPASLNSLPGSSFNGDDFGSVDSDDAFDWLPSLPGASFNGDDFGSVDSDDAFDWPASFGASSDSDDFGSVDVNDPFGRPTSFDLVDDPNGAVAVILANYTPEISAENAADVVDAMEARNQAADAAASERINSMPTETMAQSDARLRAIHEYNLAQANEQVPTYQQAEAALRADGQHDQADAIAERLAVAEALVASSSEGLYPTKHSEALAGHLFDYPITLAQVSLVHRHGDRLSGFEQIMPGSSSPTDPAGNPISTGQQAANIYNGGVPGGEFVNVPVPPVVPPAAPTPPPVREHQSLADENANNFDHSYSAQDAADDWAAGNNDLGEFG